MSTELITAVPGYPDSVPSISSAGIATVILVATKHCTIAASEVTTSRTTLIIVSMRMVQFCCLVSDTILPMIFTHLLSSHPLKNTTVHQPHGSIGVNRVVNSSSNATEI